MAGVCLHRAARSRRRADAADERVAGVNRSSPRRGWRQAHARSRGRRRASRQRRQLAVPSISADGRFVTFVSDASNLVADDRNRALLMSSSSIVRRKPSPRQPSRRRVVGQRREHRPSISGDGRFVAFQSERLEPGLRARLLPGSRPRTSICCGTCSSSTATGHIIRRSAKTSSAAGWNRAAARRSTRRGLVVAFSSRHAVDADDGRGDFDLFVRAIAAPDLVTRPRQPSARPADSHRARRVSCPFSARRVSGSRARAAQLVRPAATLNRSIQLLTTTATTISRGCAAPAAITLLMGRRQV